MMIQFFVWLWWIFFFYVLILKVLPFVLYPNYMLPGKVERYPALVELSQRLRGKDRRRMLIFRWRDSVTSMSIELPVT